MVSTWNPPAAQDLSARSLHVLHVAFQQSKDMHITIRPSTGCMLAMHESCMHECFCFIVAFLSLPLNQWRCCDRKHKHRPHLCTFRQNESSSATLHINSLLVFYEPWSFWRLQFFSTRLTSCSQMSIVSQIGITSTNQPFSGPYWFLSWCDLQHIEAKSIWNALFIPPPPQYKPHELIYDHRWIIHI